MYQPSTTGQLVPYIKRLLVAEGSGGAATAVIWPFVDQATAEPLLELLIDSNVLLRPKTLSELKPLLRRPYNLNINMALVEQWLSNEAFRSDPAAKISEYVSGFVREGFYFPKDFALDRAQWLQRNSEALRYNGALQFAYIALTKKLLDSREGNDHTLRQLTRIRDADIPRFSCCLLLAAVSLFLKNNQHLKLVGDKTNAYSYVRAFFDYQIKKKKEAPYITARYLQNRAGDLSLWLSASLFNALGAEWLGEPVVVTQDKILHRFVFRLMPLVSRPEVVSCSYLSSELPEGGRTEMDELVAALGKPHRGPPTREEKCQRLRNLFALANEYCDAQERVELDRIWEEWIVPGFSAPAIN
ncbi:hypothetical protein [Muricoccus aerilatus]|uniref:hypothetical protein n=1 Tax=Muricoccus aerilatus TaxID=452982 RepID=UPI0012EBA199|nr:hypothetical protein [Roseomonas aerilata]